MSKTESDTYVPTTKLSSDSNLDVKRIEELKNAFKAEYLSEPTFIVRVPGRVNIIGEHIDYCGYPVLPMAIQQNILLAVSPSTDNILYLKNTNPKYRSYKTSINEINIEVPESGGPAWYSYFLCGIKGIFEHMNEMGDNISSQKGFLVMLSGNVPPAAGLSSSSALVCAAVLCSAFIFNIPLHKQKLATIAAQCERYIGTQGGGMDQAIAFLAEHGTAQYIEWNPLTATPISLPVNAIFVIANSLTEANKAASHDFNQRVVECRLGCKFIAKKLNLPWRQIDRFATLQKHLNCTLTDMIKYANSLLTHSSYVFDELLTVFEIDENDFRKNLLTHNTQHLEHFKLQAQRVEKFREYAVNSSSIQSLAQLMNESHTSLDTYYECSHENLNKLVDIGKECVENIGIRLTGAGWGGCVVALCDSISACESFINAAKQKYYSKLRNNNLIKEKELNFDDVLFMTSPQRGAEIFIL
uniref:CSON008430 protein n=1 Tax=Culicoides sonorensis TaxID=179676 RepID=A0A336LF07_CULSO